MNSGRQWPSIAAPPASTPARCESTCVATSAGAKPFSRVEQNDGQAVPAAVDPPDVRPADVAAAELADVRVLERADEPVPRRDAAGEVPGDDQDREGQRNGIP